MENGEGLSRETLIRILESAPGNLFFKDTKCRYRFVSEVCKYVNAGEDGTIVGKTDLDIFDEEIGRKYYEDDLQIMATGEGSEMIDEFPDGDDSVFFKIQKNPVIVDGEIIGVMGVITYVTNEMKLERELEELSFKDKLTGLRNRNYMEVHCDTLLCEENYPVSLVVADCNYLKQINDTMGHEYGDLLLQRVADALKECAPQSCTPIRLGGDEFLLSCKRMGSDETQMLISRIKQCLAEKSCDEMKLDVAFGFYTVYGESDEVSFGRALHFADQDMYRNKHSVR